MHIRQLKIKDVRNLSDIDISLDLGVNAFIGDNGSGKTSLLEAIYLLHAAKSFRSFQIQPIISYGKTHSTVYANRSDGISVGVRKGLKETKIKINKEYKNSVSQLAEIFPMVLIYQDLFAILDEGPSVRRKILDWGVFHVEPTFNDLWKNYNRALKQRNFLLKKQSSSHDLAIWDKQLVQFGEALNQLREKYILRLVPALNHILSLFNLPIVKLNFLSGWKNGLSLEAILEKNLETDRRFKTTSQGPHRADINFLSEKGVVKSEFSRGQKKLFLCALKFAQASLLDKKPIFLIDDLDAELDESAKKMLQNYIHELPGQIIITSLSELNLKSWNVSQKYKLKKGVVVNTVSI